MRMEVATETWPLKAPFRITGHMRSASELLVVTLEDGGLVGRGEAAGVRYRDDTVAAMVAMLEKLRPLVEAGLTREELQEMMPPCGARNALDCALWDLEAKRAGVPVWTLARMDIPAPLLTTFTCGADEPAAMAAAAVGFVGARAIKLKLTGEAEDADRVRAVRSARPDVWLCVDANQGFTPASLDDLIPTLVECRVELLEQPFPASKDDWLEKGSYPLLVAADESLQCLADLARIAGRFDMVNIKLDKCGGLTEGLAIAKAARNVGLMVMVGNMVGTSLAMAPAMIVGQLCQVVDLDGPALLKQDRNPAVVYRDGKIEYPATIWGTPIASARS